MSLASYRDLISRSHASFRPVGLSGDFDLPDGLFPHQRACVEFALRSGSNAMFLDTGLGKTFSALAWGNVIVTRTNKPVLMLAPLGVTGQHKREADERGIDAIVSRDGGKPTSARIVIANYERLHLFDPADFAGVILDESSILKSFTGQTTKRLIQSFAKTPYRLACTATPAPNDHTELGTHSEFLGIMGRDQMLMRWFLHDSADTGTWRLKGHAVKPFWDWVASWSRCVSKPSDLGFSDDGFVMPELRMHRHLVNADRTVGRGQEKDGQAHLFRMPDTSATSIHVEKRLTIKHRVNLAAELVFGDWECHGSQNTPNVGGINTRMIPSSVSVESSNHAPPTKTGNTCEPITRETPKSLREHQKSAKPETSAGDSVMRRMLSTETPVGKAQGLDAPTREETHVCDHSTALIAPDMTPCLLSKMGGAPSAEAKTAANAENALPSIIATPLAPSEDCYAEVAIKALASSVTTSRGCKEQSHTLKNRDWWVIWCDTDYEQDELEKRFGDYAFSIRGSHSAEQKEAMHDAWLRGERKALICKPVMFGYGMNWQHCHKMVFVGLSFSYEAFYQAIRRCWRFRQKRPVDCHVVLADTEAAIWDVISRKAGDHDAMKREMSAAMARAHRQETRLHTYNPTQEVTLPAWMISNG